MTISGIASSHVAKTHHSGVVSQDWQALEKALKSGDLKGAQSAFATLQNDMQKSGKTSAALKSGQASQTRLADQAIQNIGKALAAGDVAGAQKAFGDFRQQVQTLRQNQAQTMTSASPRYNDHDGDDSGGQVASAAPSADQDASSSPSLVNISA